ncbi:MAG: sigma-E factor negative regulatory protein [Nitrosomonas sp.]|nr:sigma-E factor negative regulatory protein [Nitrosomonas sp.]
MNSKLSDLVDGELGDDEADELIKLIGKNDEMRVQWKAYHVIGEALRQPAGICNLDISEKVRQQLVNEPTLLAPRLNKLYQTSKSKLLGLSAAASIAVLAVGWIVSVSIVDPGPVQQEMLVADKMEKRPTGDDNRSITFLPPLGYPHLPVSIDYSRANLPFIYRESAHGSVIHNSYDNDTNQAGIPQMPQISVKPTASGN